MALLRQIGQFNQSKDLSSSIPDSLLVTIMQIKTALFANLEIYVDVTKNEWLKSCLSVVNERMGLENLRGDTRKLESIFLKVFIRKSIWEYQAFIDQHGKDSEELLKFKRNLVAQDQDFEKSSCEASFQRDLKQMIKKCASVIKKHVNLKTLESLKQCQLTMFKDLFPDSEIQTDGYSFKVYGTKLIFRSIHPFLSSVYLYRGNLYYVEHKKLKGSSQYIWGMSSWKKSGIEGNVQYLYSMGSGTPKYVLRKLKKTIDPLSEYQVAFLNCRAFIESPYIVHEEAIYYSKPNGEVKVKFIRELWDGDLSDLLSKGQLTDEEKKTISLHLILALKVIHENGWCHRDLSWKNCLYRYENGSLVGGIGDFGFAYNRDDTSICSIGGTFAFAAPEYNPRINSTLKPINIMQGRQADIFSLGLILFLIRTNGQGSYLSQGRVSLIEENFRASDKNLSRYFTSNVKEEKMIAKMMDYNRDCRPTIFDVEQCFLTPVESDENICIIA